jgi:tyrosine-protein phosphatase SIW14
MISKVDNLLYRGPRPDAVDCIAIKKQFLTVISLEGTGEDLKESKELYPVPVISYPIGFSEIYFTGISQQVLQNILMEIMEASRPVLVHCQHGEDRTGLVVAAYRVRACGWTKQAAWLEALQFGYRNWLNFGLNKTWTSLLPAA